MARHWDARAVLEGLVGDEIRTLTGRRNRILRLTEGDVWVGTEKSPGGKPVPIDAVQHALDLLARDGIVEISVDVVGYRGAFVGAVLATLPGAVATVRPRTIRI